MAYQRLLPDVCLEDLPGELPYDPYAELHAEIGSIRRKHVKKRARKRFDVILSDDDIDIIEALIRRNQTERLAERDNASLHRLRFFSHEMYIVHAEAERQIMTILTEEYARGAKWVF